MAPLSGSPHELQAAIVLFYSLLGRAATALSRHGTIKLGQTRWDRVLAEFLGLDPHTVARGTPATARAEVTAGRTRHARRTQTLEKKRRHLPLISSYSNTTPRGSHHRPEVVRGRNHHQGAMRLADFGVRVSPAPSPRLLQQMAISLRLNHSSFSTDHSPDRNHQFLYS